MQRIKVRFKKAAQPFNWKPLLRPLFWVWPLNGAVIPTLLLYGLWAYGNPSLLISQHRYQCAYFDLLGSYEVNLKQRSECPWYRFRKVTMNTHIIKTVWEEL